MSTPSVPNPQFMSPARGQGVGRDGASGASRWPVRFGRLSRRRTGRTDSAHVGDAVRERNERGAVRRAHRRWLGVLIGILAVLVVAEITVRVIEPRLPEPADWFSPEAARLVREMNDARAHDIRSDLLVTGSSQAGRDLVPAVLRGAVGGGPVHSVALAKGGQTLVMRRWLLEEAVPRLRPRSVVWGVSSLDFNQARREESIGRYDTVRATRPGFFGAADRLLAHLSALARHRAALREPLTALHALTGEEHDDALVDRRPPRAITFTVGNTRMLTGARRARMLAEEPAQTRNGPLRNFSVGSREIDAFRTTLSSLKALGINVHVVIMPVQQGYIAAHPRGAVDYERWRRAVTSAAQDEGVPISDHTSDFGADDFLDFEHLNPAAARTFSRTIASEVRSEEP